MRTSVWLCGIAVAMALVAGCSSDAPVQGQASSHKTVQLNPVGLIRKAGCNPEPGVRLGRRGLDDSMFADCMFLSGSSIMVRTYADTAARDANLAEHPPEDGTAVIVGPSFLVYESAPLDAATGGFMGFDPEPQTIANLVGGTVQQ